MTKEDIAPMFITGGRTEEVGFGERVTVIKTLFVDLNVILRAGRTEEVGFWTWVIGRTVSQNRWGHFHCGRSAEKKLMHGTDTQK